MSFVDGLADTATQILGDASAPYALFSSAQRYIGTLAFDVTIREVHSDEFTITVHPVETGTPISDHVFANPKIIEISVGASDSSAGYDGYVQDVYQGILALANTRQPFDVSTGKRFYSSMLFGNISVVTDETSEYTLMATFRLQEVILTSTQSGSGSSATSGMTAANQADPASTAPETQVGAQTAQPIGDSATLPSFSQSQSYFGAGSSAAGVGAIAADASGAPLLTSAPAPSFAQI